MDHTYSSRVGAVLGDQSFAESIIFAPLISRVFLLIPVATIKEKKRFYRVY